ncbi:MAG: hypothetical protein ACE5FS_03415 [Paracoccaceae bacterium]
MSSPRPGGWFRMYDSVLDDPKLQKLLPETFRGWVNLLCLAKRYDGDLPGIDDIAFALRLEIDDAQNLIDTLIEAGLLEMAGNSHLRPHNWSSRQYKSDTSTERVKRYRERKRNVTKRLHETAPESESESESESPPIIPPKGKTKKGTRFQGPVPTPWRQWTIEKFGEGFPTEREAEKFTDYWLARAGAGGVKLNWEATWRNWCRTAAERLGMNGKPVTDYTDPEERRKCIRYYVEHPDSKYRWDDRWGPKPTAAEIRACQEDKPSLYLISD